MTQIYEGSELAALTSTVIASGIRECLLPAAEHARVGSTYSAAFTTLENCGVKVTPVKKNLFQNPSMDVEQVTLTVFVFVFVFACM